MAAPLKDSRRALRVKHDSVLELLDEEGRLIESVLKLHDVSGAGAGFTTTHAFAKGAKIRGRLRLLGVGVLDIAGRIVRLEHRGNATFYAVEFDWVKTLRS